MIHVAEWFSPGLLQPLGLALLHFLWQGAALAALAALVMSLTRNASTRYVLGIAVLVAMVAAPVVTFVALQRTPSDDPNAAAIAGSQRTSHALRMPRLHTQLDQDAAPESQTDRSYVWLVEAWFLGVLLFSMRTAGGVFALERLRRREATTVCEGLLERCLDLQRRLGVQRAVRYCESIHLDAPAVIGWARPVVLLPFSALTGLSQEQLEAVIAHELAHIKRYDAFVNLFQVAAESMLFYHPAIWWLNKRIRAERENCCDDAAIAICGSPLEYARALTLMEEWRATPLLAMAANHGPLASRVRRLLGAPSLGSGTRTAGLAAGVLFLSVAVAAGNALFGVAHTAAAPQSPASERAQREKDLASAIIVRAEAPTSEDQPSATREPVPVASPAVAQPPAPNGRPAAEASVPKVSTPVVAASPAPAAQPMLAQEPTPAPQAEPQSNPKPEAHESYVESMKAAGLTDLSVDDLIAMKVQGITPAYVRSMQAEGLKIDPDSLVSMKVQGITPEYVRELRAEGLKPDVDELVGMKVQGITPEYIRGMKELGLKIDADDLVGMKVQGVTPEYVKEMRAAGIKVDSDDLIGMKVQGITPAYVKEIQGLGLHPDADELVGMKVQGITPEYVKAIQAAGLKFDIDDLIGAKVQGVTPQFIEQVRSHGFKNLTLEKLIELKVAGVLE
jgi:beta-lactamase regulating signal transducer with metallopeptidase domain